MPGRATSRWWKEEREGVFIDYNQNARDRTVASAYSVRAVPDARVSCPLEWDEVPDVEPAELRLQTVPGAPARARRPVGGDRRARRSPRRRCSSWPRATSARASATRPGRRTSASRRASRRACSRAARASANGGARVSLPLAPPLKPQLALSRKELPAGEDYAYEVKLDGFRCLAFVDGEEVFLQSRNGKPLGRYFPELVASRPGATCSTARSSCATATGARTSTRSASASTRRSRASSASSVETPARLRRLRPARRARTSRCSSGRSPSAAPRSRSCSRDDAFAARAGRADGDRRHGRARPSGWLAARRGSDRQGALGALPPGRAQGDGRRSSACARSTRSSSAGARARSPTPSAR